MDHLLDEIDLDDLDLAAVQPQPQRPSAPARARASDAFVSTKKRIGSEPPSFLVGDGVDAWMRAMKKPAPVANQGNFSRAYRSFASQGEVSLPLAPVTGEGAENGSGGIEANPVYFYYHRTLSAALELAGSREPPASVSGNAAIKARLARLYLPVVAKDLKPHLQGQRDFEAARFPAIADVINRT
jgi:hypothetical protein